MPGHTLKPTLATSDGQSPCKTAEPSAESSGSEEKQTWIMIPV